MASPTPARIASRRAGRTAVMTVQVFLAVSLFARPAVGTSVFGLLGSANWTADAGPYLVIGNTLVVGGAVLTVGPGVTIQTSPGAIIQVRAKSWQR
jgi:hypothetical protein